jgi:hypothetical protein
MMAPPRATAAASKDCEIELFGLASDLSVTSRGKWKPAQIEPRSNLH